MLLVRTRVPIHVIVNDMRFQGSGLGERLAARIAGIRFYPRMCPHVPSQGARMVERMAARLTDIRFCPRMRSHVRSQAAGLRVCLSTIVIFTLEVFLSCMRPHVLSQVTRPGEGLATVCM